MTAQVTAKSSLNEGRYRFLCLPPEGVSGLRYSDNTLAIVQTTCGFRASPRDPDECQHIGAEVGTCKRPENQHRCWVYRYMMDCLKGERADEEWWARNGSPSNLPAPPPSPAPVRAAEPVPRPAPAAGIPPARRPVIGSRARW